MSSAIQDPPTPFSLREWVDERQRTWRNALVETPLLVLLGAAILGILLAETQWGSLPIAVWTATVALLIAFLFSLLQRHRIAISAMLLGVMAIFHAMHIHFRGLAEKDQSARMATEQWTPVVFEGIVDAVPRWRPDLMEYEKQRLEQSTGTEKWQTLLELQMTSVRDGQRWRSARGRVVVTAEGNLRHLLPGDRVRVYAKWQRIPIPTNPGQFNMAAHYARRNIYVRCRCERSEQLEALAVASAFRLDRWLAKILERGDHAIHRYVAFGQANLASALVLGQREQVEWELQESLLATGTMHMLAISGLHVEMVAISIVTLALFIQLPRRMTLLITGTLVVCYGILCGGQPPVMRAVVLVVAVCVARWLGRATHAINLLSLAGLILLLDRTSNLFDIGTQLSFIAVAMLGMLAMHTEVHHEVRDPFAQVIYESRPSWQRIAIDLGHFCRSSLQTSTWVWVVTAPLILSTFHVISPIAILLNLVLWLPLLVALLSGLGILAIGTWFPLVGMILGGLCGVCLGFTEWIIAKAEHLPGSHFWCPAPSLEWTMTFYCILLLLWTLLGFQQSRRWISVGCMVAWSCGGLLPSWNDLQRRFHEPAPMPKLVVTVIDVGHGSAILLQLPNGESWLYDSGRMGDSDRSFMPIASVLWSERLRTIDGMILSHADADHFNAMPGIAKRFAPRQFCTTEQVMGHSSPPLRHFLKNLESNKVELNIWGQGGEVTFGDVRIRSLHPPPLGVAGNDNANSLCLQLEFANRRLLFTGDLESPGTEALLSQPPTHYDILMAPHHGSVSQDPRPFLNWCQPHWILISGGVRASTPRVLEAYHFPNSQTWITNRDGALRIEIEATGAMEIFHWKLDHWESLDHSSASPYVR